MKIWVVTIKVFDSCGESTMERIPCTSKEIAKSYADFCLEDIKQRDSFQESGDIDYFDDFIVATCSPDESYQISITEEDAKEKSAWEE